MISLKKYQQFITFCFLALSYNVLAYATYAGLVAIKCNYLIASTLSFILGVTLSYFMNKNLVFKNRGQHHQLLVHYLAYYLSLLALNLVLLYTFVHWLKINPYIAQLLVTMTLALISYNALRLLFRNKNDSITANGLT